MRGVAGVRKGQCDLVRGGILLASGCDGERSKNEQAENGDLCHLGLTSQFVDGFALCHISND